MKCYGHHALQKNQAEKYCSLIYCERKIMYHD
jgi:hypothetical protein